MKRLLCVFLLVMVGSFFLAGTAFAEISFFGTAKIKPTWYSNFDFNNDKNDALIVNEAGLTKGQHVRAELRLGWKASGEKWKVMMIAEVDSIMEKDNADRSFYVLAADDNGKERQPNTGAEFGIERCEFTYSFLPQLELESGWNIRFLDIKTGGLLYGDDHPFVGFRGKITDSTNYEVLYIPIQNRIALKSEGPFDDKDHNDWEVYTAKLNYSFGKMEDTPPDSPFYANRSFGLTVSPFFAYSDNNSWNCDLQYYGLEVTGQTGPIKPYFEIVLNHGDFDDNRDIKSWAMFGGVELPVNKAFNPYVAFRFTQGDDDSSDNDVEGWVGITDIGRFTGLLGMDGNILGEDLGQSYGATLYSYSPERALSTNRYGGISNNGSGDNPGQKLLAIGSRGDLSGILQGLLYKTQAFFIWYDETDNLTNAKDPGKKVDDYAGTTVDVQLLYAFSKNFSIDYIFSTFIPGKGQEDVQDANDPAFVNMLTMAWSY